MAATRLFPPAYVLNLFSLTDDGRVRWRHVNDCTSLDAAPVRRKLKRMHDAVAGAIAGSRPVHGRGRLVMCSGHVIITGDIAAAIRGDTDGYDWPWQAGISPAHILTGPPDSLSPDVTDDTAARLARSMWGLERDTLIWRTSPHRDKPAGSTVAGSTVAGGRVIVTTQRVSFWIDDVKHLLLHGFWPWEAPAWD